MKRTKPQVDWPSTSLLFGVLSLGFGLLTGIPAIVSGHVALKRIKANPAISRRWMARVGLMLGYITTMFSLLIIYLVTHVVSNSR